MHLLLAQFNLQQSLATGVIGGGAGIIVAAVLMLFKKPEPGKDGQPPAEVKKPSPLAVLGLVLIGLALVVVGIMWRVASQRA